MSNITISKEFSLWQLAKFVALPVLSRFFISMLCTLDDGLFISRCCGEYSLAAFSLLSPYFNGISIFCCLVCGISTFCSIRLGEQKKEEAQSAFTTMALFSLGFGAILLLLFSVFKTGFLKLIGATDILLPYAESYLSVAILYIPLLLCNEVLCGFFTIAGKPSIGAWVTIIQTVCNFFFDWLFMVEMRMGLSGTAWSNFISNFLIFILSVIFFSNKNREFHFNKPQKDLFAIIKQSFRFGQSDALTCLALCFTGYVINHVLLLMGAEETLAAYAIVNTLLNMFIATFSALFGATSPIVSYAHGEKNRRKLARILKQVFILFIFLLILDIVIIVLFQKTLIDLYLFSSTNQSVRTMATLGLTLVPFALPFFGINAMAKSMYIATEHQKAGIFISLFENVVAANLVTLTVPAIFGVQSIWYCFVIREALTLIVTFFITLHLQKRISKGEPSGAQPQVQ